MSKTIADNLKCKAQSVNNSIKKLKDKGLIETTNSFVKETQRKYRHIYLPGTTPKNKNDKVSDFFEIYTLVEDNKKTRAIIGDWIYHHKKSINWVAEKLDEYYLDHGELLDADYLREIYSELTREDDFQDALHKKKEALNNRKRCKECDEKYDTY